jgi:hypothetical protein
MISKLPGRSPGESGHSDVDSLTVEVNGGNQSVPVSSNVEDDQPFDQSALGNVILNSLKFLKLVLRTMCTNGRAAADFLDVVARTLAEPCGK